MVGEALAARGFEIVDGVDISLGMLGPARAKGVYRHLVCADLTRHIGFGEARYDAGLCIGSLGAGHVGSEHLAEMLRPLAPGAPFVIIMNGRYYETGGFQRAFEDLQDAGLWTIRRLDAINYMTELERPGWLRVATNN